MIAPGLARPTLCTLGCGSFAPAGGTGRIRARPLKTRPPRHRRRAQGGGLAWRLDWLPPPAFLFWTERGCRRCRKGFKGLLTWHGKQHARVGEDPATCPEKTPEARRLALFCRCGKELMLRLPAITTRSYWSLPKGRGDAPVGFSLQSCRSFRSGSSSSSGLKVCHQQSGRSGAPVLLSSWRKASGFRSCLCSSL